MDQRANRLDPQYRKPVECGGTGQIDPKEVEWQNAKQKLLSDGMEINFENLSQALPELLADTLRKEGAYVRDSCDRRSSYAAYFDCSCHEQLYLEDRSKSKSFADIGGSHQRQTWEKNQNACFQQEKTAQHTYQGCIDNPTTQPQRGTTDSETYCRCIGDNIASNYKDILEAGHWSDPAVKSVAHLNANTQCKNAN